MEFNPSMVGSRGTFARAAPRGQAEVPGDTTAKASEVSPVLAENWARPTSLDNPPWEAPPLYLNPLLSWDVNKDMSIELLCVTPSRLVPTTTCLLWAALVWPEPPVSISITFTLQHPRPPSVLGIFTEHRFSIQIILMTLPQS